MSSHFTVVYDACVLYPAPLRDLLMRLALTDRFRARWSNTPSTTNGYATCSGSARSLTLRLWRRPAS